ncbi:MAG: hypothetical protein GDA40_11375 [Rhodobacteraceae bacterium]|nr:hypothetical protein [Paracoccaceae bacterium]
MAGLATGFIDLDKKLGGLHLSDLSILAGRPSMDKTACATDIAFRVARPTQRGTDEGREPGGLHPSDLTILASRPPHGQDRAHHKHRFPSRAFHPTWHR